MVLGQKPESDRLLDGLDEDRFVGNYAGLRINRRCPLSNQSNHEVLSVDLWRLMTSL